MPPEIVVLIVACAIFGAFVSFIVARAIMFVPKHTEKREIEKIDADGDRAAYTLSEMIKCKTVSSLKSHEEDEREFLRFEELLPTLFPNVYSTCEYEKASSRAILFRWRGISSDSPTVLMAHYDVVSAVEENWEKPPFDGVIENGVLWGRGALDTKGSLNGILSAAERLIGEGYIPQNDVYFAFGADEETLGTGAIDIVNLFKSRGITPAFVLDEGGAVIENVFPGVSAPCALIGIAEKGIINLE